MNTIMKEIRIHIHDQHCWVEYETKTGRISKIDTLGGLVEAQAIAGALRSNVEHWTEEE